MTNLVRGEAKINLVYAKTVALKAVHFILNNDEIRQSFITSTGILLSDFENSIENLEFLGGVLDYLLSNEKILIEFCTEYGITPEEPSRIRQVFPGATYDY